MRNIILVMLILLIPLPLCAASGIKGRAAWRGELVPEIRVRAYRSVADISQQNEVAVSAPAGLDGTYTLNLPPGSYYLTARDYDGAPRPGKHFCYYSGAPVTVREGGYTNVGFNLIRIPEEPVSTPSKASGIRGEITFRDEPLERSYLYVYKDPSKGFKGPAYHILPVEKGTFRLRLPPGDYYLLARKREKGGQFGPIERGDYFNYYYGNPVRIDAGVMKDMKIETITRLSMLEEGDVPPFRGVRGTVLGTDGRPVRGIYVFAYLDKNMSGTPSLFSQPTGEDGRFELSLPGEGPYFLLAREAFGGPAAEDEFYGKYSGKEDHSLKLSPEEEIREVTIRVEKKNH